MSDYEKEANWILEEYLKITQDEKQAKQCAVFMVTNLMRHSNDRLFYAKVLLSLEGIIL
jgi:hypothetical protein